jgi:hypothetical protein
VREHNLKAKPRLQHEKESLMDQTLAQGIEVHRGIGSGWALLWVVHSPPSARSG